MEIILTVKTIHEVRNQQSRKVHPTFKLSALAYTQRIQGKLMYIIKYSKLLISSVKGFRQCHLEVLNNLAVEPPDKSMYLNFIGHRQCDFQSVIAMLSTLMSYLNLTWYDKVLAFCQTDSYDMEFWWFHFHFPDWSEKWIHFQFIGHLASSSVVLAPLLKNPHFSPRSASRYSI